MAKAIILKIGSSDVLAETDPSVELPGRLVTPPGEGASGIPKGMQPVVNIGDVVRDFNQVKSLIIACAEGLHETIASIPRPDRVTAEFGIKLAGEGGVPMLTKVSGEANFKVAIEWKNP